MNNFFLPTWATSKNVLPTFQTFCPDGDHFAQTVVHFAHFQNQARKEQGLVVVFWAKSDPIWAQEDSFGQFARKVSKSALELGKKNSTIPSIRAATTRARLV